METKKARQLIGIGWLHLEHCQHKLYKFFRIPTIVDGYTGPELPPGYAIEQVNAEHYPAAFRWIVSSFWKDHGVWYAGRPGVVFSPSRTEIFRAVKQLHRDDVGELLRHPVMIPAPIAFDWNEFHTGKNKANMVRYPFLSPKRSRRSMRKLRDKFPASGDLAWLPLDVVYGNRDEYGNPIKACHDWTTGPAY